MSPTVGPRVEFDPGHYPRIRVWDAESEKERYVYLHRLTAYAHGIIPSLWSPLHVHHKDGDRWNGRPENLEGLTPEQHDAKHGHTVVRGGQP